MSNYPFDHPVQQLLRQSQVRCGDLIEPHSGVSKSPNFYYSVASDWAVRAAGMLSVPILRAVFRTPVVKHNGLLPVRTFKSELKIKWVRPVKIPSIDPVKSGDLSPVPHIDEKDVPPLITKSEEFKNASDLVKRLFTLEFSPRNMSMDIFRRNMVKSVRRHQSDWGSFECTIAHMTAVIRNFQDALSKNPHNKKMKVQLKELIEKRKKYLKFLRRSDYKRFEWLLEKLQLQYRPPPSHFHWITRKESLQKLSDKYCEDLKEERLKAYKVHLESQKIDFLTEKVNKLKWIIEEEKACGVTPSVAQDDIDEVVNQLEDLKMKREMMKETVSAN